MTTPAASAAPPPDRTDGAATPVRPAPASDRALKAATPVRPAPASDRALKAATPVRAAPASDRALKAATPVRPAPASDRALGAATSIGAAAASDRALWAATLVRVAYGAALCCAPGPMLRLEGGPGAEASPGARTVARILGSRHIVQALLSAMRPTPAVLAAGAGTDLLHSASMIALAVLDRPRRRLGLSDSLVAAAFAAGSWALARRDRANPAPPRNPAALPSLP